jgi:fructokinase
MQHRTTVVGLGEIVWDLFPHGRRFGGAPANFVCSVAELAADRIDAALASGVGRDPLGTEAIESLKSHGVDTHAVAQGEWPTGQVLVTLDAAGHASYEFPADTAWDHLAWSDGLAQLAHRADAVCFGTLAQRSEISRQTVLRFIRETSPDCLRVLDVNLRPPFWSAEVLLQSLALANVLKLNDTELPILADVLKLVGTTDELLQQLVKRFPLKLVALTRGADGALLLSATGQRSDVPGVPTTVVDTVGAGDSFTAALVIGLLEGLSLATINAWGNRVAAFVTSQPGATPHFPEALRRPE